MRQPVTKDQFMSDKKQTENKPTDDIDSAKGTNAERLESTDGLSTSITMSTAANKVKSNENKTHATDTHKANDTLATKNNDKSTAPVKKTATTSNTKATSKATQQNSGSVSKGQKGKISKIAVLALIIALLALAAVVGHYFWLEQKNDQEAQQLTYQLSNTLSKQLQQSQAQVSKQLAAQEQQSNSQLQTIETSIQRNTAQSLAALQQQLTQFEQKVASLGQKQPSDWLVQEAEYLIRIATRSLWLEKNTPSAISLLNDADLRIQELNDPQFLTLRQVIQQDIAKLQSLPKLATDDAILKLMALEQQTKQLPLALIDIPDTNNNDNDSSLELSDSAIDWRENLAKTWRKFINEFFTITRRHGDVEPLMSPQFQQNLRENLSLKLQTAIWAASKAKSDIYLQALSDIQRWLNAYFDMTQTVNSNFSQTIESLKAATISVDYPNSLAALNAIRQLMLENKLKNTAEIEANKATIPETETTPPDAAKQDEAL